jgi:hypothetical protein
MKIRNVRVEQLVTRFGLGLLLATFFLPSWAILSTQAQDQSAAKLRHVVVFKFKDTATQKQIESLVEALCALKEKIPQVISIESGTNNSPEHLNKGLTHAFLLTFASEKDRDIYLTHPDHLKFKKLALPLVADVFVIDFFGKP